MERVIVVVPYCSIIEQTAQIYRDIFAQLNGATIVEHHSAFDIDTRPSRLAWPRRTGTDRLSSRLLQFFDSLYANKPSRCRKLHRIAKSVVILDEAQILPTTLLAPCMSALRALRHYGASIVLCTATQPALGYREDFRCGLKDVREIIPDPIALYQSMRRVKVNIAGHLPDGLLLNALATRSQVLCIIYTPKHAARLAFALAQLSGTYHLSARMCPAHRLGVLAQIKQRFNAGLIHWRRQQAVATARESWCSLER